MTNLDAIDRCQTSHLPRQSIVHRSIVQRPLTNIVVMGMGEPMANYDHTWAALRTITDPDAFGLGARHITISTVGLPQGIRRMAAEPLQVNLAVSLHAPNDTLRARLVPINLPLPDRRGDGRRARLHRRRQPAGDVRVRADGQDQRYPGPGAGTGGAAQAAAQPDRRGHVPRQPDPAQPGRRVTLPAVHPGACGSVPDSCSSKAASRRRCACAAGSTSTQVADSCGGGWRAMER